MTNANQTANSNTQNTDPAELQKFAAMAAKWWDTTGDMRPLHDINPLRLDWIAKHMPADAKTMLDVGCGGGLVAEGLAQRFPNAAVQGIDMANKVLSVARLHALDTGVANVTYSNSTAEAWAEQHSTDATQYDCVTALEMLEHVPDPAAVVDACARMAKSGAPVFFSTLNRNPLAYATAVLGAEYVLKLLPKGTHDYAKFITPAELAAMCRAAGLEVAEIRGMEYNPWTHVAKWSPRPWVNYAVRSVKR